jgi:hypothetical protein
MHMSQAAAALVLVLAGCAAEQTKIVQRESTSTGYIAYRYTLNAPEGAAPYQVWLRPYNEGGMLFVCGYLTSQVSGVAETRIQSWWQAAQLSLNDTPIGTGHFLQIRKPGDLQGNCVETKVAWKDEFQSVPLRLRAKGPDGSV